MVPPMVTVKADRNVCIGAGECARLAPQAFDTDDEGLVVTRTTDAVDLDLLRLAARNCPSDAITIVEGD
jgi:ferredoxin